MHRDALNPLDDIGRLDAEYQRQHGSDTGTENTDVTVFHKSNHNAARRQIKEIRPKFIATSYRNVMQTGLSVWMIRPVYSMRPVSSQRRISTMVSLVPSFASIKQV